MSETIHIRYIDETLPRLAHVGGSAKSNWIDLYCAEAVTLKRGENARISLGVAMKLPEGYEAHVVPRSSTFKKWGVLQVNSVGIIDSSYCGPNDAWCLWVYATRDTVISKGDRLCQFRIEKRQPDVEFVESDLGGEADRGGFGTTGSHMSDGGTH